MAFSWLINGAHTVPVLGFGVNTLSRTIRWDEKQVGVLKRHMFVRKKGEEEFGCLKFFVPNYLKNDLASQNRKIH